MAFGQRTPKDTAFYTERPRLRIAAQPRRRNRSPSVLSFHGLPPHGEAYISDSCAVVMAVGCVLISAAAGCSSLRLTPGRSYTTTCNTSGPLSVVDSVLADHAEAVVKEAVSNAVRHAEASELTIHIHVTDGRSIDVIAMAKASPTRSPPVGWRTCANSPERQTAPSPSKPFPKEAPGNAGRRDCQARTTEHTRARPADRASRTNDCACRWGGWLIWDF